MIAGRQPGTDRGRRRRGFTLLEVMVALMILATSLVILIGNHSYSIRLSGISRNLTIASMLAKDMMTTTELEGYPPVGEAEGDFQDRYPGFRWRLNVDESMFPEVREVRLEILWGSEENPEHFEVVEFLAAYQYQETVGATPAAPGQGGGNPTGGQDNNPPSTGPSSPGGGSSTGTGKGKP